MNTQRITFAGPIYGWSHVDQSADGEWTVTWNKLKLFYSDEKSAENAAKRLSYHGDTHRTVGALRVEVAA